MIPTTSTGTPVLWTAAELFLLAWAFLAFVNASEALLEDTMKKEWFPPVKRVAKIIRLTVLSGITLGAFFILLILPSLVA